MRLKVRCTSVVVFTGQEHDEKTGLIYFGARFYDPDTARFINQDSYLGESGTPPSLHRYLYAYSNPTVYIDPDGYSSVMDAKSDKVSDGVNVTRYGDRQGSPEDQIKETTERKSEFDRWCEKQGGDCDHFVHDKIQGQNAKRRGVMTGESKPSQPQSTCPTETPQACLDREILAAHTKRVADGVAAGGDAAAGLTGAKGLYDLTSSAGEIITWMKENPGKSIGGGAVGLCLAVPKCKAAIKNTGTKVIEKYKGSGAKGGKAKNHNRDSQFTDDEAGQPYSHPVKPKTVTPESSLKDGAVDNSDIQNLAGQRNLTNEWVDNSNKFPAGGFKYKWEGNGYAYQAHGHGPNPVAQTNYPSSNSAQGPTVSVTRKPIGGTNSQRENLLSDGTWERSNSLTNDQKNKAHIPLKNSQY